MKETKAADIRSEKFKQIEEFIYLIELDQPRNPPKLDTMLDWQVAMLQVLKIVGLRLLNTPFDVH